MNRYASIIFSAIFVLINFLPCQVLAASITPTKAEIGEGCTASDDNSTAMGRNSTASGYCSTAMGDNATASGYRSIAMGDNTTASGEDSTAMGWQTTAGGFGSTAMGNHTTASGENSTAMGGYTTASGVDSTAMGGITTASGNYSTAMGWQTTAGGQDSFAGGHRMELTANADHTFVWGHSNALEIIDTSDAFLIFPAGTPGRMGIGTKTPQNLLDLGKTLGKKLALYQGTGFYNFYGFGISDYTLEIYASATSEASRPAMVVKDNGNVGINITDPSYKLHVNGSVAGTSWTNLSSREYKEDIQIVDKTAYPMMLAKLVDMELTTYKYKKEYGSDGDTKLGFIAEDMPKEVLSRDGKGVDIYELLALTIGAMKAQQKKIEELENQIQQLKSN